MKKYINKAFDNLDKIVKLPKSTHLQIDIFGALSTILFINNVYSKKEDSQNVNAIYIYGEIKKSNLLYQGV